MLCLLAVMAVAIVFLLLWIQQLQAERIVSVQFEPLVEATPPAVEPAEVRVNITKEGEYIVSGHVLSEAELFALLHRLAVNNPGAQTVHIRAHRDVPFRYPLTVIGICKKENMTYYCTVLEEGFTDDTSEDPE